MEELETKLNTEESLGCVDLTYLNLESKQLEELNKNEINREKDIHLDIKHFFFDEYGVFSYSNRQIVSPGLKASMDNSGEVNSLYIFAEARTWLDLMPEILTVVSKDLTAHEKSALLQKLFKILK